MAQKNGFSARIVLLGLGDTVAGPLQKILCEANQTVYTEPLSGIPQCLTMLEEVQADIVFCAAEPECYSHLLEAIHEKRPGLPIIVVGRWPEVPHWLDALEAGASDYCTPPFDSTQVCWVLEAALKSQRHTA